MRTIIKFTKSTVKNSREGPDSHSGQSMGCAACFKQMGWKFGQVFLEKIWKLTQNQAAPPHVQINPKVFNLPLPRTESRQGARH